MKSNRIIDKLTSEVKGKMRQSELLRLLREARKLITKAKHSIIIL